MNEPRPLNYAEPTRPEPRERGVWDILFDIVGLSALAMLAVMLCGSIFG